mmetsp:Transcript_66992/g.122179  ORF Transcript_66992/g.122179 Transcript_66992/m.122179 type:complete len:695 (+) Transcript_66992:141-2225(+)
MKNLPVLAGGRGALVGTYFAEQVSGGCYDLVSVSHAEQQRRPVTSQQSGSSRSAAPATPGSARGRRRHLQEQDGVKCTILPALEKWEPLLSEDNDVFGFSKGGKDGRDDNTEDMTTDLDKKRTLRENNVVAQAERVKQASMRLWRGARPNREGAPCGTGDEDFLASLTRPLGFLTKLEAPQSRKKESSRGNEKKFKKKHKTYSELFRAGLAGTELEVIPLQQQRGPTSQKLAFAKDRAAGVWKNLRPIQKIPKDAVESYFKAEMDTAEDRQLRGLEDLHSLHEKVRLQAFTKSGVNCPPGFPATPAEARKGGPSDGGAAAEEALFLTAEGSTAGGVALTCECGNAYLDGDKFCRACGTKRPASKPAEAFGTSEGLKGVEAGEDTENGEGAAAAKPADAEVLEPVSRNAKIGALRREACQLIRFFFFGNIGNETRKGTKEKEKIYYDTIGSREQVRQLFNIWDRMDSDNSRQVDFPEFRAFVDRCATDRGQSHERRNSFSGGPAEKKEAIFAFFQNNSQEDNIKFASKLVEKVAAVLMSKKPFFVIEDMMRLIWPCSSVEDLKKMKQWCEEFALTNAKWRVPTPKVLSANELEALSAVFKYFDKDGSGTVTAEELVHSGLLDREQASRYMAEIDTNGDGEMALNEFCEMMCPNGYRATTSSMIGTDDAGRRVVLDEKLGGWRREDDKNVKDAWSG